MSGKKRSHGELVAASDPPDQHFVGGGFARRYLRRPCGGRSHTGADHVVHGAIPFNHVPLIKSVRTGKIPTPICDQLTVRRGVTTVTSYRSGPIGAWSECAGSIALHR